MKKGLLLLGAAALCTSAYAQQEAGWVSASNETVAAAWGWDGSAFSKDKTAHDAGTLMMETANVTMRTTFADDCSVSSINKLSLNHYAVNNVLYTTEGAENNIFNGGVGNTNPAAITDLEMPVINKGWVLDYEVKADGYLTVFSTPSMNKNFYVVEGVMGDGQVSPNGVVAYEMYFQGKPNADLGGNAIEGLDGTAFTIKLPANEDGYIDLNAADIATYVDAGAIMWPYRILLGGVTDATAGSYGTWNAATVFPVYEGCHYYVFATGSKLTGGPFVYTKEKPTQIAFVKDATEEAAEVVYNLVGEYSGASVEGVANVEDANAPIYNMMGVRVNADAKGILIQNGKKFIRK